MKSLKIVLVFIFFSLTLVNIFAQVNLTQGLVAYYPFSGNANDASGNGNNGTVHGATLTTDRLGNSNSAYSFNGTSDYINFSAASLQNSTYSYSLWVKAASIPSVGNYSYMLSVGGTGADQSNDFSNNANGVTGWIAGGLNKNGNPVVSYVQVGSLPNVGQWYHIAITRDNSNLILYVNGKLIGNSSTGGLTADFGTGTIGVIGARCTITQFFNGSIDDVRIYNRILTNCEINSLADIPYDLNNGLMAYYPFSGNANDASGNGNNGTVYGATLTADRFGNSNSAYNFDGSTNYILVPTTSGLTNKYFTISTWVNIKDYPISGDARAVIDLGGAGGDGGIGLNNNYYNNTGLSAGYNTSSTTDIVTWATFPNLNEWVSVIFTRDNNLLNVYINGILKSSISASNQDPYYVSSLLAIGSRYNQSQFFSGIIDDVRIYDRALSSCEISDLANDILPLSANAGTDQSICTNSTSLNGNTPSIGSGTWSLISGSGTISSSSSATTTVTNLGTGTNVFRWTITYGNQSSHDDINIVKTTLTNANAGPDQNICSSSVTTLVGNNPTSGSGLWTMISGSGNIANASSASTSISNLGFGSNVFKWTISNGCGSSSDPVIITVDTYPSIADAGADQNICVTSTILNANTPSTGIGSWTILSGSGVIAEPSNPATAVSSLAPGYTIFRWTIKNGCGESYDDVVIASHSSGDLSNGLIGKYDFSGNTNDLSGNFNNGAVYNVSLSTDRFGNLNSAYWFNGNNAYIALSPSPFAVSSYTYIAWVKIDALPLDNNFLSIISIGSNSGDQNFGIGNNYYGNSGWSLNSYKGVNDVDVFSSGTLPQTGKWYFVAATRDNQEINFYVNDQWVGTIPVTGSAYYGSTTVGAHIGSRSHDNFEYFNGSIDDVRIYGRALSICEISDLYDQEVTGISKPINDDKLRIFPNPVSGGKFNIETTEVSSTEVIIFNSLGTVVYKGQLTNGTAQIDVPYLVKGVYFMKLKTEGGEVTKKLEILN